jgi:hypothetical protein
MGTRLISALLNARLREMDPERLRSHLHIVERAKHRGDPLQVRPAVSPIGYDRSLQNTPCEPTAVAALRDLFLVPPGLGAQPRHPNQHNTLL